MASKPYPLRLDDRRRARWEAAAAVVGLSLAEFVKQTVDAACDPDEAAPAPRARARSGSARGVCPRERHHRPGVFCKGCGTVP